MGFDLEKKIVTFLIKFRNFQKLQNQDRRSKKAFCTEEIILAYPIDHFRF